MTRRVQWPAFWVGISLIAVIWYKAPASSGVGLDPDLVMYKQAVGAMQDGDDYYTAMDEALNNVMGPAASIRAYRTPTLFWFWSASGTFTWHVALIWLILGGFLVALLSWPLPGLVIAAWLVFCAHPPGVEQWGFVELWVLPLVLLGLVAARHDRWTLCCGLIFIAAISRELVAPVLLSGAFVTFRIGRDYRPWVVAAALWAAFFTWHSQRVVAHLSNAGTEAPLIGTGGPTAVVAMAGPLTSVFGILVVIYALWRQRFTSEWWFMLPLIVGIPLAGIVVDRIYWGFLVLPVAVAILGQPSGGVPLARASSQPTRAPVTREAGVV